MSLLLVKLATAPVLMLAATLAVRRWGETAGGFLVGLSLTSGPISFFLAVEQEPAFSQQAASGSLVATAAQAGFCLAYCPVADRGAVAAIACASAAFLFVAAGLQELQLPPIALTAAALVAMAVALRLMPVTNVRPAQIRLPRWDLPARMVAIAVLVGLITLSATRLGPAASGVLASFPIIGAVLALFAHRSVGADAARQVLKGMTAGLLGFVGFFFFLSQTLGATSLFVAYAGAVVAALLAQGAWWACRRRVA